MLAMSYMDSSDRYSQTVSLSLAWSVIQGKQGLAILCCCILDRYSHMLHLQSQLCKYMMEFAHLE